MENILKDRKKLLNELDELCSKYVRTRDNKCILCGKHVGETKKLQSHHWIVSRARSTKYRFDERNCVSLCYGCHIGRVHHNPTIALLEELKDRAIINKIVTPEEIEEIKASSNIPYKMTIAEIEDKINYFKEKLNGKHIEEN